MLECLEHFIVFSNSGFNGHALDYCEQVMFAVIA